MRSWKSPRLLPALAEPQFPVAIADLLLLGVGTLPGGHQALIDDGWSIAIDKTKPKSLIISKGDPPQEPAYAGVATGFSETTGQVEAIGLTVSARCCWLIPGKRPTVTHEDFSRQEDIKPSSDRSFGLVIATFFLVIAFWPLIRVEPVR